jgi:hypothetical protein
VIVAHLLGVDHIGQAQSHICSPTSITIVFIIVMTTTTTTTTTTIIISVIHNLAASSSAAPGHTHGPDHSTMPPKLQQVTASAAPPSTPLNTTQHPRFQMNELVESAMAALPPKTLFIVMGDHGAMRQESTQECSYLPPHSVQV